LAVPDHRPRAAQVKQWIQTLREANEEAAGPAAAAPAAPEPKPFAFSSKTPFGAPRPEVA
jgi:hypothetical protein